jgi:hypothetical protein
MVAFARISRIVLPEQDICPLTLIRRRYAFVYHKTSAHIAQAARCSCTLKQDKLDPSQSSAQASESSQKLLAQQHAGPS